MSADPMSADRPTELGDYETIRALPSMNLGYHTKLIALSLADFQRLTVVANRENLEQIGEDPENAAQRGLNEKHAFELGQYMLKGLMHASQASRERQGQPKSQAIERFLDRMGSQSYLSLAPVVATIPDVTPGPNAIGYRPVNDFVNQPFGQMLQFPVDKTMHVIDGQHRRYGAMLVLRFLEELTQSYRYPKKASLFPAEKGEVPSRSEVDAWLECLTMARRQAFVLVEVHMGLNIEQQRQLFYDLNNRGLKVSPNQKSYDNANPAIRVTKELQDQSIITLTQVPLKDWDADTGAVLYKDAVAVTSLALANSKSEKGVKVHHGDSEHTDWAVRMWRAIAKIPQFGSERARFNTVAAQPVVLKGIARALYEAVWLDKEESAGNAILEALPRIDFSHKNPVWRLYVDPAAFKQDAKLQSYVPQQAPSNGFSEVADDLVKFRLNHADIYPILASIIRRLSKLQPRIKR